MVKIRRAKYLKSLNPKNAINSIRLREVEIKYPRILKVRM